MDTIKGLKNVLKKSIGFFVSPDFLSKRFWKTRNNRNWDYQKSFPDRFRRQKECLERHFIPHLKRTDNILDLGCSDGSCTAFLVAGHCHHIDGFDLSEKLVDAANARAKATAVNARFQAADLERLASLEMVYDHAMMMGLLTYFVHDEPVVNILKTLNRSLKSGALVALKDSLSIKAPIISKDGGYAAHYRNKSDYLAFFEKAGFTLLEEETLSGSNLPDVSSYFFTLKKIRECP